MLSQQVGCKKVVILPAVAIPIDWFKVYELLGMLGEYDRFALTIAGISALAAKSGCWAVPMLPGVTCNRVVVAQEQKGVCLSFDDKDLDLAVNKHDRHPDKNGPYVVWVAGNEEADEHLGSVSANRLKKLGVKGITLPEHSVLDLGYFLETGKHLDQRFVTHCVGSRDRFGDVPYAYFCVRTGTEHVHCYNADNEGENVRARQILAVNPLF